MRTKKEKVYVLENWGEYLTDYDKDYCGWSPICTCALVFKTYQKAYSKMKSVNKHYGYTRCTVTAVTEYDVNWNAWQSMKNYAV